MSQMYFGLVFTETVIEKNDSSKFVFILESRLCNKNPRIRSISPLSVIRTLWCDPRRSEEKPCLPKGR